MIKKTTIILAAMISLGFGMDEPIKDASQETDNTQLSTEDMISDFCLMEIPALHDNSPQDDGIFPLDVIRNIFKHMNEKDRSTKAFRNQVFVSKLWRNLAIESVRTLDIIELMEKSPHRKCTLLAYIIADYPIHRFPNLNSLNISFSEVNMIEFHKKLNDPEKRIFKKQQDYFSDDRRLDRIENKMNMRAENLQITLENPEVYLVSKIFTAIGGGINLLWNAAWHAQIIGEPFKREEIKNKTDSISGDIEKIILTNLLDLKSLTILNLGAWDNINLFFLEHMPNLKRFKVKSLLPIFADALGNMHETHDLETLHLSGPINLSCFECWSKFHKLKKLYLNIYFAEMNSTGDEYISITDPDKINKITQYLAINLPKLEILKMANRFFSNIKLCEYISQFQKLTILDLRDSLVNDPDLMEIAKINSLQKLILHSHLNDEKSREEMVTGLQKLNLHGGNPFGLVFIEPCTQKGLDDFRLMRPDIKLTFKEPKKFKINFHF